jgi:hypothetical protein
VKLMPVQSGICGFEGIQQAKFLMFSDRGGVIVYYARHGVGRGALCFAVKILLHFN